MRRMILLIDSDKNTVIVTSKVVDFRNIDIRKIRKHPTSADLIADIRKFLKGEYPDDESEVNI